jgi:dTDP-4-dehydrorhamnose reductase
MTCSGSTSWYGFAEAIFARKEGQRPVLNPIPSSQYPTPAKRPGNSVLSNAKLTAKFGIELPSWETALDRVMDKLARAA